MLRRVRKFLRLLRRHHLRRLRRWRRVLVGRGREHQVGGRGSVTHLKYLLPLVIDPDRSLLDWILRNTTSYWYYAHGTRSVKEFDAASALISKRTAERVQQDQERQLQDQRRIAGSATANLYNAVRRDDIKAVRALLRKGADAVALTPDGESLLSFSDSRGHVAIATELRSAIAAQNAPNASVKLRSPCRQR